MMRDFTRRPALGLLLILIGGLLSVPCSVGVAQNPPAQPAVELGPWQQELSTWRTQREKDVSAPDGWLTLAGLVWLKPGINSVGAGADNQIRLPGRAPEHLGLLTVNGMVSSEDPSIISIVQLL